MISRVEEPTPWCAGMVVVPKKSGAVHICADFRPLNDNALREVHPLLKVDEALAQMAGAIVISMLDANCRFWQIPLDEQSRSLTTFITLFRRYCFNKLPFGISSVPEHFQWRMNEILAGQEGVLCHMDNILIFGQDQKEHDARLHAALGKIQEAGATLNPDKCEFSKQCLTFLGHHQSAWYIPRPQQDCSSSRDGDTQVPHRIEAIHGDGEPVRQVHPQHCRALTTCA